MTTAASSEPRTDRYLTVQEIADHLAVSQLTVRRIVHRGELAAVRVGERQLRVSPDEFQRYLERCREGRRS